MGQPFLQNVRTSVCLLQGRRQPVQLSFNSVDALKAIVDQRWNLFPGGLFHYPAQRECDHHRCGAGSHRGA